MFEPKKKSPRWLKAIYPYLFFLRYDGKLFFKALTGRVQFWWHYSWESDQTENRSADHPDFKYEPGSFIGYNPERPMRFESYRIEVAARQGISAIVLSESEREPTNPAR